MTTHLLQQHTSYLILSLLYSGLIATVSGNDVYVCEGSTMELTCEQGKVISIERANYGRTSPEPCNDSNQPVEGWNLECYSHTAVKRVNNECQGKPQCWMHVYNPTFGDPCPVTPKYLFVQYKCIERPTRYTPPATTTTVRPTTISTTTEASTTRSTTPSSTTQSTTTEPPSTTQERTTTTQGYDPLDPEAIVDRPVCPVVAARNITWPPTLGGYLAAQPCPNNLRARATWVCSNDGVWVDRPNLSECVSEQALMLQHISPSNPPNVDSFADQIELIAHEPLYGGDVIALTSSMNELNDFITMSDGISAPIINKTVVENVHKKMVKTSSMLLDKNVEESWMDLPQAMQADAATNLIDAVEKNAFTLAKTMAAENTVSSEKLKPVVNIELNIRVEVNVISTNDDLNQEAVKYPTLTDSETEWLNNADSISIPMASLKQFSEEGLARLVFIAYKNLGHLLHSSTRNSTERKSYDILPKSTTENPPLRTYNSNSKNSNVQEDGYNMQSDQEVKPASYKISNSANYGNVENKKASKPKKTVNTNVISATINDRTSELVELQKPILYTLEHKNKSHLYNPTCSFWEYSHRGMDGRWSGLGCTTVSTNASHTTCSCTHLTNFAVLMDVVGTELPDHHNDALTAITYIGCIISIIALFLCFLTFVFIKNIQCERNTIHKNLVLSLMIAELIFLCGIAQYERPTLCSAIAVLLHYFFLCAFAWMCLEGIQLYILLVEVFESERSNIIYYYLSAYGIPAVVVGISAAIDHTGYGTDSYCWLRADNGFVWAFAGPVAIVITINIAMLSIAIYVMCKHATSASMLKQKEKTRLDKVRSWMKGATVLVVLLGLTWAFGLLYVSIHTLPMAYLFTIMNSLQGTLIFVFHCLLNEKVQKEYKRCVRHSRWLPEWFRVHYGGAKANSSSSPATSSSANYFQKLLSGKRRKKSESTNVSRFNFFDHKVDSRHANSPPPVDVLVAPQSTLNDYTEDPGGYLEPTGLGANNSYMDIGDLPTMSNIEGSMVDSDFLLGKTSTPINVEKYKIGNSDTKENVYCSIHTLPEEPEDTDSISSKKHIQYNDQDKRISPECRQNLMNKIISNEHPSNNSIYKKQILDSCSSSGVSGSRSTCSSGSSNHLSVFDNKTTSTHLCMSSPDVSRASIDVKSRMHAGKSLPVLSGDLNNEADC